MSGSMFGFPLRVHQYLDVCSFRNTSTSELFTLIYVVQGRTYIRPSWDVQGMPNQNTSDPLEIHEYGQIGT